MNIHTINYTHSNAREAEAHAATIVPEANTAIRELRILAADIRVCVWFSYVVAIDVVFEQLMRWELLYGIMHMGRVDVVTDSTCWITAALCMYIHM